VQGGERKMKKKGQRRLFMAEEGGVNLNRKKCSRDNE